MAPEPKDYKSITVRLPEPLYRRIEERARRHYHSFNAEVVTLLQKHLRELARAEADSPLDGDGQK